jgi:hypothetical protein
MTGIDDGTDRDDRRHATEIGVDELRPSLELILASPTPDGLWALQKALLTIDGPDAARAREIARSFHACLRTL